jgi:hypothetical protein
MSEPTDSLELRADLHMDLAEVLQLAGRPASAFHPTERARDLYERKGHLVGVQKAEARLANLRAEAAGLA